MSKGRKIAIAVIALALKAPALLDQTQALRGEQFSSSLLGRVYDQLMQRHAQGHEVSLAVLVDFTAEEMSHVAGILQRQQGPVNEQALSDCVRTIQAEFRKANVSSEDDLLALRERMKERKGIKE